MTILNKLCVLIFPHQNSSFYVFGLFVDSRGTGYEKAPKSTKSTKTTKCTGGGEAPCNTETQCWNKTKRKSKNHSGRAFWCFMVLCGLVELTAKCITKHSCRAFWCFLVLYEQREDRATTKKHQKARNARKAPKAREGGGAP